MNLIIVDNENEINKIKKSFKNEFTDICLISEFCNINTQKYKKIFIISIIEKYFLSFECQDFLMNFKSEIFLFPVTRNDYGLDSLLCYWINPLNKYSNAKISHNKIVVYENYLEEFMKYFSYIISEDYKNNSKSEEKESDENLSKNQNETIINHSLADEKLETVEIYTDGACSGNPGAGGWGVVLLHGEKKKEVSGYEEQTTNNRMELLAVIKGLSMLKRKCNVELYSDSAYVVNAITQSWLENWKKNGWKNSSKETVKNVELWKELDTLLEFHNVNFNKVKGHSDNFYNNRCDELATGEIARNQ